MTDAYTNADRIYEEELSPYLPPDIIDFHVHIGLREHCGPVDPRRYKEIWAMEVGTVLTWEECRARHRELFPRQRVHTLAFGNIYREANTELDNEYVLAGARDPENSANGLAVVRPEWDADTITQAIADGFVGIKPYPDLAPRANDDTEIYDFAPKSHLAALDALGGILMLHLPRAGRLADPDNIRDVLEISENYPSIKLIIAHIGRAYCMSTAKKGLPHFVDRDRIYFDTAANLNPDVFAYALETVGPDRILFGSDLPVTMMRGVREHVGATYVNYTAGQYSWNTNRKSPEEEARYTYFVYEELRALIKAVRRYGCGADVMRRVMYSNAAALLGKNI